MNLAQALDETRRLIACGWHEPMSLDASGKLCSHEEEGIARFCLDDALLTACAGDGVLYVECEAAIVKQLYASAEFRPLRTWLDAKETRHADVLRILSRAARHHAAKEAA